MRTSCRPTCFQLFLFLGLLSRLVPVAVFAADTIVVNSLADPGTQGCDVTECTLREAIAEAPAGSTIRFDSELFRYGPGIITLTAEPLIIARDLMLSGPGAHLLALSGDNTSRVLYITNGVVTIWSLTITQGYAVYGGGILNQGMLTLESVTVQGNTATHDGGGIVNDEHGALTLLYSKVISNTAYSAGGGIRNYGTLVLTSSTVSDNTTDWNGAGIVNDKSGTLTLLRSTVHSNAAYEHGGGILNYGRLTLTQSSVRGNTASHGGGLNNQTGGLLTLTNSTVSENSADFHGGGVANWGKLRLTQSTVSANTAHYASGGGLANWGVLRLHTTIVAGNTTGFDAPDCFQGSVGTLQSQGYNLVGRRTGCPSHPRRGDVTVEPDRVFSNVLQPLLSNSHHLIDGSPAIDAGDPQKCKGPDQNGHDRPNNGRCDIGAVEYEPFSCPLGSAHPRRCEMRVSTQHESHECVPQFDYSRKCTPE